MNYCIAINFKTFAPLMVDNISDNVIHSAMLGLPKYLQRNTYTPRKENIVYINEVRMMTRRMECCAQSS